MQILFTRKSWNLGSLLIRWAVPASRFRLAAASHCMIVDGGYAIEAVMWHLRRVDSWFPWRLGGVRRVPLEQALHHAEIVDARTYHLPDELAGIEFARSQVGRPYDFTGAVGLALVEGETYHDNSAWFCFELGAASMRAGGRAVFADDSRISDTILLAIAPGVL